MTRVADTIDEAQSRGRYSMPVRELDDALDSSAPAVRSAVRRLVKRGRLTCPRRGFLVIVPAEYRATGSPPASWFIDDLMSYLGKPYYVGLLSAASIHGSSHQYPQVFQVLTPKPIESVSSGRVRIEFHRRNGMDRVATQRVKTETGSMVVSTPETTLFDLIRHPGVVGHLSNVATVLGELADSVDPEALHRAALIAHVTEVQRAGYLLDLIGREDLAAPLLRSLRGRRTRATRLRPDQPADGSAIDSRWRLTVNEVVEPDL